jgi:hypothetical protein
MDSEADFSDRKLKDEPDRVYEWASARLGPKGSWCAPRLLRCPRSRADSYCCSAAHAYHASEQGSDDDDGAYPHAIVTSATREYEFASWTFCDTRQSKAQQDTTAAHPLPSFRAQSGCSNQSRLGPTACSSSRSATVRSPLFLRPIASSPSAVLALNHDRGEHSLANTRRGIRAVILAAKSQDELVTFNETPLLHTVGKNRPGRPLFLAGCRDFMQVSASRRLGDAAVTPPTA